MNLNAKLADLNLVESWYGFVETNVQLIKEFIPANKVGGVSNKGNRYLSVNCIEAIKVKHRKLKKYKLCKTDENFDAYRVA